MKDPIEPLIHFPRAFTCLCTCESNLMKKEERITKKKTMQKFTASESKTKALHKTKLFFFFFTESNNSFKKKIKRRPASFVTSCQFKQMEKNSFSDYHQKNYKSFSLFMCKCISVGPASKRVISLYS